MVNIAQANPRGCHGIGDNDDRAAAVALKVLVVDDERYHVQSHPVAAVGDGVRTVYEANDGNSGLEAIRTLLPDVVIVDWEMPSPNGPEFVRMVRSPGLSRCLTCRSS